MSAPSSKASVRGRVSVAVRAETTISLRPCASSQPAVSAWLPGRWTQTRCVLPTAAAASSRNTRLAVWPSKTQQRSPIDACQNDGQARLGFDRRVAGDAQGVGTRTIENGRRNVGPMVDAVGL